MLWCWILCVISYTIVLCEEGGVYNPQFTGEETESELLTSLPRMSVREMAKFEPRESASRVFEPATRQLCLLKQTSKNGLNFWILTNVDLPFTYLVLSLEDTFLTVLMC